MKNRLIGVLAVVVLATGATLVAQESRSSVGPRFPFAGAVYTMSNAADGNAILMFDRLADGRLVPAGTVATGGNGSGAGLGNQGGLVLSGNEKWLLTVNAGSDSISVMQVRRRGLRLIDVEPSGGSRPISITSIAAWSTCSMREVTASLALRSGETVACAPSTDRRGRSAAREPIPRKSHSPPPVMCSW